MKKDNRKTLNAKHSNKMIYFVGVCFFSAAFTAITMLIIGAAAAVNIEFPYSFFVVWGHVILTATCFSLSFIMAKQKKASSIVCFFIAFLFVMCTVCFISILINSFAFGKTVVYKSVCCMFGSLMGLAAANRKKKIKRG